MNRLDELGRRLAAEQDRTLDTREDIAEVRQRLAAGVAARTGTRRAPRWATYAVAAGLAAALATGFLLAHFARSEATVPSRGPEDWQPGAWITAPDNAGVPIRFADGSVVRLEPGAEASVLSASADTTRMVLRHGTARVDVVHRDGVRWELEAGPFVVRITGTRFRVGWDPAAQTFDIGMEHGAVDVTGPMLADGRRMAPGEVMQVWVAERRVEVRSDRGTTVAAAPSPPPPVAPTVPAAPVAPAPAATSAEAETPRGTEEGASEPTAAEPEAVAPPAPGLRTPRPATPAPSWRDLARAGRYRDAVAAAEAAGFDRLLASSSATDLVALGDAARLGGRANLAEKAYQEARRRFAGTSEAGVAAFDLARLAFDVRHDYDAAARWLRVCLAEPTAGGLAREASGRLIEALQRAGRDDAAAEAAREYLRRDPNGPHAEYARALLGQDPAPREAP